MGTANSPLIDWGSILEELQIKQCNVCDLVGAYTLIQELEFRNSTLLAENLSHQHLEEMLSALLEDQQFLNAMDEFDLGTMADLFKAQVSAAASMLQSLHAAGMLDHPCEFIRQLCPAAVSNHSAFYEYMNRLDRANRQKAIVTLHLILQNTGNALGRPQILEEDPDRFYDVYIKSLNDNRRVSKAEFRFLWSVVQYWELPAVTPTIKNNDTLKAAMEYFQVQDHPHNADRFLDQWFTVLSDPKKAMEGAEQNAATKEKVQMLLAIKDSVPVVLNRVRYEALNRDDSEIESALLDLLKNKLQDQKDIHNILLVNPSPYFLEQGAKILKKETTLRARKRKKIEISAVIDHPTEQKLYELKPHGIHFFSPNHVERPDQGYDVILICSRDKKVIQQNQGESTQAISSLYKYISAVSAHGSVMFLVAQMCISNEAENRIFFQILNRAKLSVEKIIDLPATLGQSAPRKKMIVEAKRLSEDEVSPCQTQLIHAEEFRSENRIFLVFRKIGYTLSDAMLRNPETLHKKENEICADTSMSRKPRYEHIYSYTAELSARIILKYNHSRCPISVEIQMLDPMKTSGKYKRVAAAYLQRLEKEPTREELNDIVERCFLRPDMYEQLAPKVSALCETQRKVSLKFIWYYMQPVLLLKTTYQRENWQAAFSGRTPESKNFRNLIVDEIDQKRFLQCAEKILGPVEENLSMWLQLKCLILEPAVQAGLIRANPLADVPEIQSAKRNARSAQTIPNLRNRIFSEDEQCRMHEFLVSPVVLNGEKWTKAAVCSDTLGSLLVWKMHLDIGEARGLRWCDISEIPDCTYKKLQIVQFIKDRDSSSIVKMSNASRRSGKARRTVALPPLVQNCLSERWKYLTDACHISEEALMDMPILVAEDPRRGEGVRGRKSYPMQYAPHCLVVNGCKSLVSAAKREKNEIYLGEESRKHQAVDLNQNGIVRILHSDCEYHMLAICGFEDEECQHYFGRRSLSVYGENYADLESDAWLCKTARKLQLGEMTNQDSDIRELYTRDHKIYAKEKMIRSPSGRPVRNGRCAVDLAIRANEKATGRICIRAYSEFGMRGYVKKDKEK